MQIGQGRAVSNSDRVLRPFWLHQTAEYLIGLVLVAQGLQSPTPVIPALAGGLVLVNTACVDGPVSAFHWFSRRTHRKFDLVVIAVIVFLAAMPFFDIDNTTRIVMAVIAVILAVVWWNSSFAAPAPRRREELVDRSEAIGRGAGRVAGNIARAVRDRSK
jgi:hypothetical protein